MSSESGIIERFLLQDQSSRVMAQYSPPQKNDLPPRQCLCLRALRNEASTVDLKKSPGKKRAHYTSLQTCGSVWTCPVCASKISEVRKNEVQELIDKTSEKQHVFITYTVPHYSHQKCSQVKDFLMKGRRKMKAFKPIKSFPSFVPYKKLMDHYKLDGSVTTVEVTFGKNGWHVHAHELLIFDEHISEKEQARFHDIIFQNWSKALKLSGVMIKDSRAFRRRSVITEFVTGDSKNRYSDYLCKIDKKQDIESSWGIAAELTKSHLKKSDRQGSTSENLTPFGLLAAMSMDKSLYSQLSPVFYEYAVSFHGARFVFFSKGLKKKYGIADISDDEIMNEKDILASFYGWFDLPEWQEIKENGLRGWVINHSDHDFDTLTTMLHEKLGKYQGN